MVIPIGYTDLLQELQAVKISQHRILEQLPASVMHIKLTPSLATVVKDKRFNKLMDALQPDFPIFRECDCSEGMFSEFEFEWSWGTKQENASYVPFCEALSRLQNSSLIAICVANGERLMNSLLYTTSLWSLRKYDADGLKVGRVLYRGEISGRTDIVVMDHDPGCDILRHNSKFVIEVKRTKDINTDAKLKSALREATTQLLGLCGDNSNNTPPVVLTDFCGVFIVLQLHMKSIYPLEFEIFAWRCRNIKSTLNKALEASMLPCISADFGRPDTPSCSSGEDDRDS